MTQKCRYFRAILVPVIMILFFLPAYPAAAGSGLQVSGASLVTDVSPGEVVTHTITVSAGAACDITVKTGGIAQTPDGGYILLDAGLDTGPYCALRFITVDKESLHLEPGSPGEITATIKIPENVRDGGIYALINLNTRPDSSSSVGVVTAVNIPVFLTLKNSRLDHTGTITGISTGTITSGSPVEIRTAFQNTGNHHYKIRGEVTVVSAQGEILDTLFTELTPNSVIPGMSRRLTTIYIPADNLSAGTYLIKSKVRLADGQILAEAEGTFEVPVVYVPPPPPAEQIVMPDAASSLITGDGRISIAFPAGAVTETAVVRLNNYLPGQLPPLPEGYTAAAICFRVTGLPGLLAREAALKVKYDELDLANAGENTSRLKIARWDEAERRWTVLNTAVDKSNMVLTAKTDRFSVWAVVITPPSKPILPLILGIPIAIVTVYLVNLLSGKKKQKR